MPLTHASLRPTYNILFVILWAVAATLFFFVIEPHVPIILAVIGGGFGAVAGLMQHMSFAQVTNKFLTARSLLNVRHALKATRWGGRYISWLYFCKLDLIVITFLLIRGPLQQVIFGYLGAYVSLMFIRDLVTLRDTIVLNQIRQSSQTV